MVEEEGKTYNGNRRRLLGKRGIVLRPEPATKERAVL